MLTKYKDIIKFAYNFHAFGPMYIWPYNSLLANALDEMNPDAHKIFNEIWDEAKFPESTQKGNALQTIGYQVNGELNDYILHEFNIPSVSPELANDDVFSGDFFLKYDLVVRGVLKDNQPWIYHTFKKLAGEVAIDPFSTASYVNNVGKYDLNFNIKNTGLQAWDMDHQGFI